MHKTETNFIWSEISLLQFYDVMIDTFNERIIIIEDYFLKTSLEIFLSPEAKAILSFTNSIA